MCVSERVWSKAKSSWDARTEELIKCPSTDIADAERRWGPPEGHWSPVHLSGINPNTARKRISVGEKPPLIGMVTCDWTQLPPLRLWVFPQIPHGSFSLFHLILSSQRWLKLREWHQPLPASSPHPCLGLWKEQKEEEPTSLPSYSGLWPLISLPFSSHCLNAKDFLDKGRISSGSVPETNGTWGVLKLSRSWAGVLL